MVLNEKQKVTLNLSSDVVKGYRLAAIRQGLQDQAIVEEALREYLGLNALKRLQNSFAHLNLNEDEADQLAVEAVRETRNKKTKQTRAKS